MSRETPVLDTAWVFSDGRVAKAQPVAGASQQLPEDPFNYQAGEAGLMTPPYNLDQLARMLETNSLHYRACKAKASDTVGRGMSLRSTTKSGDPDAPATSADPPAWTEFVTAVEEDERSDESFKERLVMAAEDYEAIGWGLLEVSRRADRVPDGLWHVPGATVRAHKDGRRFCQLRGGKKVWFKRYGLAGDVDKNGGGWSPTPITDPDVRGNELIVLRNYTPRSVLYGLPDHIPALAAIAGWAAQAEFNVKFFDNFAVPTYAVVITGATLTPNLEETIRQHFLAIKNDPHRTLIIPVPGMPGDEATQPKLTFERLSVDIKDASFRMYKQDNALEICIAHGVPPYRIGWPLMGSLGGATALEMTQIYNDSIIQPRQETWEKRLNRALIGPQGLNITGYELKAAELDTRNEVRDIAKAEALWNMESITVDEIRAFFSYPAVTGNKADGTERDGDKFHWQLLGATNAAPPDPNFARESAINVAKSLVWMDEVRELADLRARIEKSLGVAA